MANPLFHQLNGERQTGNIFQNPRELKKQLQEFQKTLQGNPQQLVQQLLSSGRMSQGQYNYFRSIASQFQQLMRH